MQGQESFAGHTRLTAGRRPRPAGCVTAPRRRPCRCKNKGLREEGPSDFSDCHDSYSLLRMLVYTQHPEKDTSARTQSRPCRPCRRRRRSQRCQMDCCSFGEEVRNKSRLLETGRVSKCVLNALAAAIARPSTHEKPAAAPPPEVPLHAAHAASAGPRKPALEPRLAEAVIDAALLVIRQHLRGARSDPGQVAHTCMLHWSGGAGISLPSCAAPPAQQLTTY